MSSQVLSPPRKAAGNVFLYTILNYLISWIYSLIPSRLLKWWRWCPTSFEDLENSEKYILSHLKKNYVGQYVNIGSGWESDEEMKIWTIIVLPDIELNNIPVVLVHGFASGVGLWIMNFASLSNNRQVYAFDMLGFGKSSRLGFSNDAWEAEHQLAYSIEAWRQQMELEKFVLVGHSMGGFIATSYALQYPNHVAHLVLCDPWGFPERPISISHKYQLPSWVKFVAAIFQPFNPLASLRAIGPAGPLLLKNVRSDLRRKFSSVIKDPHAISNYLYHCNAQTPSGEAAFKAMTGRSGWARHPMINRIGNLNSDIPITFIYGSRSWVDRHPGTQTKYTRLNSFVDVQVIQGSGHHVYADKPNKFNQIILNICNKIDSKYILSNALSSDAKSSSADIYQ